MTDAKNVDTGGMGRRISEVGDLLNDMTIIDPAATVDFVGKLADENGWDRAHAEAVYAEYLRFLLMAWMSPSMVVPSHDVDQAWHLHLTHTRHYWDVLCGRILMKPLHHDPALGTGADAERHRDHYASTLSLYRYVFDEDAPAAVWPQPCAHRSPKAETVLASGATATGTAVCIAGGTTAMLSGHPFVGILFLAVGAFLLVRTIAHALNASEEAAYSRRSGVSLGKTATRGYASRGGGYRSSVEDRSGSDAALAFTSWTDPGPASTTHHSSTCDHSTTTHSTHSCSTSTHSCGGHSCGSSCGGGGCGGGGD